MSKLGKPPRPQRNALERFLSSQPEYVRADLEGDSDAANDRLMDLTQRGDANGVRRELAKLSRARAAYEKLLPNFPEELQVYRERRAREGAKLALSRIPANPRGRRRKDQRREEIEELLKKGLTFPQIGQILGVSPESARKLVSRPSRKKN